ncbi:MAG: HAD family phosphatase [Bacteroidia bacterium]|nr:HAD family phosphatase [Bacteroidia bacterium]
MHPDLTNIRNIIFDLGKVLLNLDFDASIQAFQKLGLKNSVLDQRQVYSDPVFYELETGRVTPEAFRERVRNILNNRQLTDRQINDAWCAMILDIPGHRVQTVQKLGEKYQVFLFSNTNKIHIDRLLPAFKKQHGIDFPSLFVKDFYSHELNERKPEISSFRKVIELSGVNPGETLFVDDLEKNIIGAQQAGLKTFWLKEGMEMSDIFSME